MGNIFNDEKILIGLPVEEEDEKNHEENVEADISGEQELFKIVEKSMKEQNIADFLPEPRDERADKLDILMNENIYLKIRVYELERKIEKMKDEKAKKEQIKK